MNFLVLPVNMEEQSCSCPMNMLYKIWYSIHLIKKQITFIWDFLQKNYAINGLSNISLLYMETCMSSYRWCGTESWGKKEKGSQQKDFTWILNFNRKINNASFNVLTTKACLVPNKSFKCCHQPVLQHWIEPPFCQ